MRQPTLDWQGQQHLRRHAKAFLLCEKTADWLLELQWDGMGMTRCNTAWLLAYRNSANYSRSLAALLWVVAGRVESLDWAALRTPRTSEKGPGTYQDLAEQLLRERETEQAS